MVSEKFRHQLRKELQQWQAEEIIDRSTYEQIANRYQLEQLDTAARNRFVIILLGLGSILLGLAVITFVAANWQEWSREVKVILLLSLFVGVNAGGFYLWRRSTSGWESRLGQALLLLGGLVLGANLALMSQMFHLSGAVYQLYLVWGLGVVIMAYSLRLTLLGMLALVLIAIGYCFGIPSLYGLGEVSTYEIILQHLPLIASVVLIPLAYWCRSRWLFGASVVLIIFALELNITRSLADFGISGVVAALAFVLPPAMLWAYRDSLWGLPWAYFDPVAQHLAVVFLAFGLYLFSFHYFWQDYSSSRISDLAISRFDFLTLVDGIIFAIIALYAWWRLGKRPGRRGWRLDFTSIAMGMIIATAAFCLWWHLSIAALGAIAVFIFNTLLTLLAIGLVRAALANGTRLGFWGGIILLVLQLLSRMLEYSTSLLFKAVVLFLCGVAVMAAGLWFERYLRSFNAQESSN